MNSRRPSRKDRACPLLLGLVGHLPPVSAASSISGRYPTTLSIRVSCGALGVVRSTLDSCSAGARRNRRDGPQADLIPSIWPTDRVRAGAKILSAHALDHTDACGRWND